MKIHVFVMNEAGRIVGGLLTSSESTAAEYINRKQANGLLTIKTVKK